MADGEMQKRKCFVNMVELLFPLPIQPSTADSWLLCLFSVDVV